MKYKIILCGNDHKPFRVQRQDEKSWFKIWWTVDSFSRKHDAEGFIRRVAELHARHGIGDTILEYDVSDVIIDKLKIPSKSASYDDYSDVMADSSGS